MKIAALIQVHKRPDLAECLVNRLSTSLWNVYLHVDRKADITPFSVLSDRATLLPHREKVFWAGFSQVAATLRLLQASFADESNTHFYLMSGQCFPIKSDEQIRSFLTRAACSGNFMEMIKMPTRNKPFVRLTRREYSDIANERLRIFINKVCNRLPRRDLTRLLHGMEAWAGSSWWLLDRKSIAAILNFLSHNRWYLNAFRPTLSPDECFFQTLVKHLGIELDDSTPTIAKWIDGDPHPELVTEEILEWMVSGWHFFGRKFDDLALAKQAVTEAW